MRHIEKILTPDQVEQFKAYWTNNERYKYVNYELNGEVLDHRLKIREDSPEFRIIEDIARRDFKNITNLWAAYQRQTFAHQLHIDDYGRDKEGICYTYVISMDTNPKFKTLVWQEQFQDNDAFRDYVMNWNDVFKTLPKLSNLSEVEDLDHTCVNDGEYLVDYLTADGVYTYVAGDGVLFNGRQVHCTSNWKKYKEIPYRELLQIHVMSPDNIFE
jgi:hypothetical protein